MNLEKVYERYGKEGLEAAEELVSLIKPAVVDWLASLWDGKVGAFYYATSSAQNEEFFPDSESTQQAIGLLRLLGLFGSEDELPDTMKKKLGNARFCFRAFRGSDSGRKASICPYNSVK